MPIPSKWKGEWKAIPTKSQWNSFKACDMTFQNISWIFQGITLKSHVISINFLRHLCKFPFPSLFLYPPLLCALSSLFLLNQFSYSLGIYKEKILELSWNYVRFWVGRKIISEKAIVKKSHLTERPLHCNLLYQHEKVLSPSCAADLLTY